MLTASQKQNQREKKEVQQYLAGWTKERSPTYVFFTKKFGKCPNKPELFSLALCMSHMTQIPVVYRTTQRYKNVCLKWFDEHFSILRPILENLYFSIPQPASPNLPSFHNYYPSSVQVSSNLSIPPSQRIQTNGRSSQAFNDMDDVQMQDNHEQIQDNDDQSRYSSSPFDNDDQIQDLDDQNRYSSSTFDNDDQNQPMLFDFEPRFSPEFSQYWDSPSIF